MNRFFRTVAVTCLIWPAIAQAQDVSGTWRTEATSEGYLEVEIAPCGPAICGTIARAVANSGQTAAYPHIGRQMIWGMRLTEPGNWSGGKIWDPRNDQTYVSKIVLKGESLSVAGCFLGICQSQIWQRVR